MFSVASRFFRQRGTVEEAAQEVFLKAYTQLGSYEGRGSMEGWLTKIATNTCLNMVRGAKRRPEQIVSELTENENEWLDKKLSRVANEQHRSAERDLIAADLADRVLGILSPEDRLALTMIDGDDATIKEVAEMTGWSESKVKVRAFRARRRVREAMEKLIGGKKKQEPHLKTAGE